MGVFDLDVPTKGKKPKKKKAVKVQVPYAPTPKGKAAEKAAGDTPTKRKKAERRTKAVKKQRAEARAVAKILGDQPKASERRESADPYAYKPPSSLAMEIDRKVTEPLEKAGYHKTTGQKIYEKVAEYGPYLVPELGPALKGASTLAKVAVKDAAVDALEKGAEKGLKATAKRTVKARARAVKTAPKRAASRVKETPKRVKTAPRRAKKAVSTKEGRRAVAKGGAKKAARHPVRTSAGAAAVSPVPLPGDADQRVQGFLEGSANALLHHPGETGKTTLRGLSGVITGPVALGAAAVDSVKEGTPDPLVNTAKEDVEGIKHIAETAFSGDPKKAELAARKEGSLSLLAPIPAVTKTKVFKGVRRDVREGAATVRRKVATKTEGANRRVRHAPKGKESNVFGLTERRDQRKKVSVIKARTDTPHRVAGDEHAGNILHALAKAPKGSHIALQTLAEYGVRDKKGAELLRKSGPGDKQLLAALDYAELHPQVWESKDFKEALGHLAKSVEGTAATKSGKGERARVLPQGDALGITRPEHMVPHGRREEIGASSWAEARDRLKEVRKAQQRALADAKIAAARKTRDKSLGDHGVSAIRADIELTERLLREAKSNAGRKINSNRKEQPYDDRRLREYVDAVEAARKQAGWERAIWTHHASASGDKGAGIQNAFPTPVGRKEYGREGNLAKADELDRSLEGLVRGTVLLPRGRAAGKEFMREIVDQFSVPFTLGGKEAKVGQGSKDWQAITGRRSESNPDGGQFDPRSHARLAYREWNNAVDDPFLTDTQRDAKLLEILKDAESGKAPGSEPFVVVPREVVKEARAQVNRETNVVTEGMGKFAKASNRLILGTNPAWAVAQTVAEGAPLLISHPKLANPAYLGALVRDSKRYGDRHPELRATAGVSPLNAAALRQPHEEIESYTPEVWSKGAEAMTRGKTARSALSLANLRALGEVDVRRQNAYRKAIYKAQADKKFRSWHSGLTGLFDGSAAIAKKFRGKSREELWDWLATSKEGRAWKQKLEDHVDAVQGNWSAFTRYERALAPFTIFYPFIRYSLRWATWAFPKEHPVRATVITMLGQANANQLEALVGQKAYEEGLAPDAGPLPLSNPLGYAYPVYRNEDNEPAVLPGGSRISPGQSSITQAISTGNPAAVLSSLNPVLGAGITATTGVEPFTGEKSSLPRGQAALNALLGLPSPLRATETKFGDKSVASQAFEKLDPNKDARSFLMPFLPQSGDKFASADALGRAFSQKYDSPVPDLPPEVWEAVYNKDWRTAKKLRKKHLQSEKASDVVRAAEEPFFPEGSDQKFDKEMSEILGYITGYYQVPAKVKPRRAKVKAGGIGGVGGGGIGGYSLGGGGGSIGGSTGGSIGGHPIGG